MIERTDFGKIVQYDIIPPGYVYFILDPTSQLVKIGYSINPKSRIKVWLQGSNRYVLKIVRGSQKDENLFHSVFDEIRSREGEWFANTPELRKFIDELGPCCSNEIARAK